MGNSTFVDNKIVLSSKATERQRPQNKDGLELWEGDVVVLDTTNSMETNTCVKTSNTIDDVNVMGVAAQKIPNNGIGEIVRDGLFKEVRVDGNTDIAVDDELSVIDGTTYPDYTAGTCTFTLGSTSVTGAAGATWTAAMVGRYIYLVGATVKYLITARPDATTLTISPAYVGATAAGSSYVITAKGRAMKATAGKGGAFATALEAYTTNNSAGHIKAVLFRPSKVDSSAAATLDGAYNGGIAITVDAGAVALSNTAADNNGVLTITKNPVGAQSGAGLTITMGGQATGAGLVFVNTGSGNDVTGTAGWSITKAGALTVASITLAGDIDISASGTGTYDLILKTHMADALSIKDSAGDLIVFTTTTGSQRITLTPAVTLSNAVSITTGGLLVSAGGITVTTGGIGVGAGGLTVTAGGLTVVAGGLAVNADGATVTGDVTITGALNVTGALTWGGTTVIGNSLTVDELILDTDGIQPAATNCYWVQDNSGDLTGNALSGKVINLAIANNDEARLSATRLDIFANILGLDATGDTSIEATTDNRIDVTLGGVNELRYSTGAFAFQVATIISTGATTLTLTPTTDVVVSNGKGLIIGAAAQVTTGSLGELQVLGTAEADSTVIVGQWAAAATGPIIALVKSRHATIGSLTIVTAADPLGSIIAYGDDGVDFASPAGAIVFESDNLNPNNAGASAPGAADMPGRIVFKTTPDGSETLTEVMRLDRQQNVRIADGNGLIIGSLNVQVPTASTAEMQVLGTAAADSTVTIGQWAAAATGPELAFLKSRNATISAHAWTIVVDDDVLGSFVWYADDGTTNDTPAASIHAKVHGTPGTNDMPTALIFSTTADAGNTVTERMRLGPTGQMTIGIPVTDTENANMTIGLTIDQGAADNQILCFKSTDVATGVTGLASMATETDDFTCFSKLSATAGGLGFDVMMENAAIGTSLKISAIGGQATATKTTAGEGMVDIYIAQHDGANTVANVTAAANLLTVRCRTGGAASTVCIIGQDGLWISGTGTFVGTLTIGGTIYGSTAANGDLILASTSHATEGCISIPNGTGGLILGGVEAAAWAADNFIFIKDATVAPAGASGVSGAGIYAALGELYTIDAAGNALLNSAHTPDGDFIIHSYGIKKNKTTRVHLEKLLKKLATDPQYKDLIEERDGMVYNNAW